MVDQMTKRNETIYHKSTSNQLKLSTLEVVSILEKALFTKRIVSKKEEPRGWRGSLNLDSYYIRVIL